MNDGLPLPLGQVLRAGTWWDYKLPAILWVFYATALVEGRSLATLLLPLLLLLAGLVVLASYVSIVNDATDLGTDAAAGKPNRLAGRTPGFRAVAIVAPLALGGGIAFAWRDNPLALGCYAAAALAFTAYSVPPVRLKLRGAAGVVADAAGAHVFPSLLAAALASVGPADPWWLAAVAVWALGYGMRANLCHQLCDLDADLRAGARTLAARDPGRAARLGSMIAFPLEVAALAALFGRAGLFLPALALAGYLFLVHRRRRVFGSRPILCRPAQEHFQLAMQEFYDTFLPLALLAAAAWLRPADAAILLAHVALFHRSLFARIDDVRRTIVRPAFARVVQRRAHSPSR